MLRRDFHFGGHAFRVEGAEEPLRWLQHFVEPQFAVRDSDDPHEIIRFIIDGREHARLAACGPHPADLTRACFTLDSGIVTGRVWHVRDGAEVVFDEARDVFYRRRPPEPSVIDIIAARDTAEARVALMRAVREYAMLYASRAGWLIVHAAAVCIGDDAFVIAGPKKAGKTTLLLHALCNAQGTYVSNDRVAVHATPSGPMVYGIPTIVSIRPDSTAWFPGFGPKLSGVRFDARSPATEPDVPREPTPGKAWSLSPGQLCDIVGAKSRAVARVAGLLFPQVDASTPGVTFEALGSEEARGALQGALFRSCPTNGMFGIQGDGRQSDLKHATLAHVARVIAGVPSFACRLGPDAYRDGARWLSDVVEIAAQTSRASTPHLNGLL
jgi:hypothetical protein